MAIPFYVLFFSFFFFFFYNLWLIAHQNASKNEKKRYMFFQM